MVLGKGGTCWLQRFCKKDSGSGADLNLVEPRGPESMEPGLELGICNNGTWGLCKIGTWTGVGVFGKLDFFNSWKILSEEANIRQGRVRKSKYRDGRNCPICTGKSANYTWTSTTFRFRWRGTRLKIHLFCLYVLHGQMPQIKIFKGRHYIVGMKFIKQYLVFINVWTIPNKLINTMRARIALIMNGINLNFSTKNVHECASSDR
jgi:hypothetical protein